MTVIPTVYVFTNDVDAFTKPMQGMTTDWGTPMMTFDWMYCFDMCHGRGNCRCILCHP